MKDELRVLLIEDDPDDVLLVQEMLKVSLREDLSFAVDSASRLSEAVPKLEQGGWDAVLLDINLPDGKGPECILRVLASAGPAAVVVLTGTRDEQMGLHAVGLGAQDYLVKGAHDIALLQRSIQYAVERRRLLGQMESVIRNANDAMVVVDKEGLVHYANRSAERLLGRDAHELMGRAFAYPLAAGQRPLSLPRGEREVEFRLAPVEWRGRPSTLVIMRDMTDRTPAPGLKR